MSSITDSQTVPAQTCTDTWKHETNSKFFSRNTSLQWCAGLHCDKLQVLCFLFCEGVCVEGLCLLYFHHAKEVFKSS